MDNLKPRLYAADFALALALANPLCIRRRYIDFSRIYCVCIGRYPIDKRNQIGYLRNTICVLTLLPHSFVTIPFFLPAIEPLFLSRRLYVEYLRIILEIIIRMILITFSFLFFSSLH